MSEIEIALAIIASIMSIVLAISAYFLNKTKNQLELVRIKLEELKIQSQLMKIEADQKNKNLQERQSQILNEMSDFSRAIMTQTLKITPQFVATPYQQLLPAYSSSDISLFDRRRSHFTPEKELLAREIVNLIASKIDKNENLFIILILDAGSTVYPIFQQLCTHPSFQFDKTKARRVKIITNNLPGVSDLIRYGRIGDPVVSRTLFKCRVLSGHAHSQYEATLSDETAKDLHKAIEEFKKAIVSGQAQEKIQTISVTTGNYISISDGILARDANHIETKSKMLEVADEIFVLAPLGKLWPKSCAELNKLLGFTSLETGYSVSPKWSTRLQDITMVVTSRPPEYFMVLQPPNLNTYFGHIQEETSSRYKERLIAIPFDPRDDIRVRVTASVTTLDRALREYELPHQNLRDKLIESLKLSGSYFRHL